MIRLDGGLGKMRRVARNRLRRVYVWRDEEGGLIGSHDPADVPLDVVVYWAVNSNGRIVGPLPERILNVA